MAFGEEALLAIARHRWPGNVRELLNKVKRASIMAEGGRVGCADLGLGADDPSQIGSEAELDLRVVRENAERRAVIAALARANDNIVRAAELLGVSRPTLYDLLKRLAIRQRVEI
jgi:two-component system NtrC family response regulator